MKITRRNFSYLAAALPLSGMAHSAVRDPDVVIVGAGAAGLAAAQTLINGGRSVQVIEASARVGGRCYTDTATLGVPFDRGAAWLKGDDRNPLVGLGRLYRFEIGTRRGQELTFAKGATRPQISNAAYERAFLAVSDALANAADQAGDIAAGDVGPLAIDEDVRAWAASAMTAVGPLDMGVDFKTLSVKDWFDRDEDESNRVVRQGLGTLVTRLAFGLPVRVNTPARRVSVLRDGVSVETGNGAMRARAAIVTASVGVLASGGIVFDPAPDGGLTSALNGLQMGLVQKIALRFQAGSAATGFPEDSVLIPQVADERGHVFHVRPSGVPLAICHVGGSLAWDLATQSEATNVEFARDRLRALLGTNGDRGFIAGAASDWGTNPLTRGAFAAALPGQWRVRAGLDAPIGGRVFLSGEAQAGKSVQTVHGAFLSGQRAARRVLALLKT